MFKITKKHLKGNPYTRPGKKLNKVKGIVIHWTANMSAGADDEAHFRYFNGNAITAKSYASAHYFVDQDSILEVVPPTEMAYHVGAVRYRTNRLGAYPNDCTIGVETCVNVKGAGFKTAIDQSAQLCAKLLKDHGLGITDLYRHYDVTGKDCPRYFVDNTTAKQFGYKDAASAWAEFKALVSSYLNKKPTTATKVKAAVKKVVPKKKKTYVQVTYPGALAVREKADFNAPAKTHAKRNEVFTVDKKVKSKQGVYMYKLVSGLYITASKEYVKTFTK